MITNLIQFLMTPNEVLDKLFIFIFAFIENSLYINFFNNFLNINSDKNKKFIYIIFTSLIAISANYFIPNSYSYLLNILVLFISIRVFFRQNIKNTFIGVLTTYILSFVSTFIIQVILQMIFKISYIDIITIPLYHFFTCILIYLCFYLISNIFAKKKISLMQIQKISLKYAVIINLFLGIITIFILSYIFSIYNDNFPLEIKLITILCLLIYFSISMYSLIRTNKLEQTTQDLESEKLYNKTLILLHDNIRCFKHDFNNIVQAIGGYIALNDMDGLKDYYNSLLEDCKQTNNLNILNPETINNPSIYSLLTNKYYLASEKGIKMTFNIFTDLQKINFNIYEFTRILGILLDNAIEAAQETDEKLIEIEFRNDKQKQLFIIENSCKDNNISTTKIFEKGYSTKQNNSGIGLWKVHNILSKNTNLDLFTTVQNNKFRQQLEIFYS